MFAHLPHIKIRKKNEVSVINTCCHSGGSVMITFRFVSIAVVTPRLVYDVIDTSPFVYGVM